jgi:hypothetical protein
LPCVSQLSKPLRSTNGEATRIFGFIDVGKTMFADSNIKNAVLNKVLKKNFNWCELGESTTVATQKEHEARANFFRGDWM